jgi:hypothetical protein
MLRIRRSSNGQVTFTLSGQMDGEHIAELDALIGMEARGRCIVLDLKDITLADQEAICFLERSEAHGIGLLNCAPYVREWISRQRRVQVR